MEVAQLTELAAESALAEREFPARAREEDGAAWQLQKLLFGSRVHLLHDRRLPGTSARIDHLAIGPQGVTVIDMERHAGKARVRHARLRVAGRDETSVVEGVRRRVEVIRLGLATFPDVPVTGVVCWADGHGLPMLRKLRVDGVVIDGPRPLAAQLRRPGPVRPKRAQLIARLLDARLPRCS